jgi:photosystem II stability/assembly factor-like uncharacterized protein
MRVIKVLIFLFLIAGVSVAARQLVLKLQSDSSIKRETKPKIHLVSVIPKDENGQYGLADVFLLDNGEYWAAGYDGQHTDTLFHSKDMGKTWTQSMQVSGTGYNTKAVMFTDSDNGWAVGVSGLAVRTGNGGKSWESLKLSTDAELNVVNFFNSNIGYVGGHKQFVDKFNDEVTGSVEIHCTVDNGTTWNQCYKEDEPGIVFQIIALSETEAFAVLDGTRLIRTNDQGKSWQSVPVSSRYVSSIAFAPNGVGWIVGEKGSFQCSLDRGRTWEKPATLNKNLARQDWNAVAFNSDGIGLAVGEGSALAITIDNGRTWELLVLINSDDLRSVRVQGSKAIILGTRSAYALDLADARVPN